MPLEARLGSSKFTGSTPVEAQNYGFTAVLKPVNSFSVCLFVVVFLRFTMLLLFFFIVSSLYYITFCNHDV